MAVKAPAAVVIASWTGCYVGAQLGGALSEARWGYNGPNVYNSLPGTDDIARPEEKFRQLKAVIGAQAGCNFHQSGPWLFGVEAGWIATPMDRTQSVNTGHSLAAGFTPSLRTEIGSIASVTGRVGYAVAPDWLVYAKGGYALAFIELRADISPKGYDLAWSDSNWHHGWTAGAGFEYRLFRNVTIGAEYNFYRFNSAGYFGLQPGLPVENQVYLNAAADVHSFMGRLNFYSGMLPGSSARAAYAQSTAGGQFSSFINSAVKYASWSGFTDDDRHRLLAARCIQGRRTRAGWLRLFPSGHARAGRHL
jgi:outer membrane immunogenic protein